MSLARVDGVTGGTGLGGRTNVALRAGRVFAVVLAVVCAISAVICWWAGFFDPLTIAPATAGPWHLLYRTHTGPYEGVRLAIRDVALYVEHTTGRKPTRGFSVYLDDPAEVPREHRRSIGGCLTDTLHTAPPSPYRSVTQDSLPAAVGTFRLRSFFSYMTGVFKFYPALDQYLREHGDTLTGPVIEVYDLERRRIDYVAPIGPGAVLPDRAEQAAREEAFTAESAENAEKK